MDKSGRRAALHLALGAALGLVYSVINHLFDRFTGFGTLPSPLAPLHAFFDLVLPIVVGTMLGISVHYIQVRAQLAETEKRRADALRHRLSHVERDQAVWIFVASVLHAVKNPLHTLGLLIDDIAAANDARERDVLVAKASVHVQRIAERLVELRTLSGGELPEIVPMSLGELARKVAQEIAPIAEKDGIELAVVTHGEPVAACDTAYVRVILENLIENACDAMRAQGVRGTISIDVRRRDGQVLVRVQDDGPGLDEAERKSLFEPLRSSKKGGLGLGLAISRKLARAMAGDVRYDERGGRGAFVLELSESRRP